MSKEFWLNKWKESTRGFHQAQVNVYLKKYWSKIRPSHPKVLVPLRGMSYDMMWIKDQGADVVGSELSSLAIQKFFDQNQLTYEKFAFDENNKEVYKSDHLHLYCGYFFQLTTKELGTFDVVYDRAAFVALEKEQRSLYAQKVKSFLKIGGQLLTIHFSYPNSKNVQGPPYSLDKLEMNEYFGQNDEFKFTVLEEQIIQKELPEHLKAKGIAQLNERVLLIEKLKIVT